MILANGWVNGSTADEMKNQNVNNNKALDKNLWHVSLLYRYRTEGK